MLGGLDRYQFLVILTTVQGKFHPVTDIGKACGMKGMCVHCMHLVGIVYGFPFDLTSLVYRKGSKIQPALLDQKA